MQSNIIIALLLFSSLIVALIILRSRNPVYSVLFLILLFSITSLILLLTVNEFLSLIYIIVYIGAVIVLLLWVVMTVPIKSFQQVTVNLILAFLIYACFLIILILIIGVFSTRPTISVFYVKPEDDLFNNFMQVYRRYAPTEDYVNLIDKMSIHSINGVELKTHFNVKLSNTGRALFFKLLVDIYSTNQLANVYFPFPVMADSLLMNELFIDYCIRFNTLPIPIELKFLIFKLKLMALSLSHMTNIEYKLFITHKPSIDLLILSFDISDIFNKHVLTPFNVFHKYGGMPLADLNILVKNNLTFIDWVGILTALDNSISISMATALYMYYGVALLIIALILMASMVGVVIVVRFLPPMSASSRTDSIF